VLPAFRSRTLPGDPLHVAARVALVAGSTFGDDQRIGNWNASFAHLPETESAAKNTGDKTRREPAQRDVRSLMMARRGRIRCASAGIFAAVASLSRLAAIAFSCAPAFESDGVPSNLAIASERAVTRAGASAPLRFN